MGGGLVWLAGGPSAFLPRQQAAPTAPGRSSTSTKTPVSAIAASDNYTQLAEPVVSVAKKVTPSVVNVAISQARTNHFTGQQSSGEVGNGSGIIIRSNGYILTNNHVVESASQITVRIGSKDMTATVVGTDSSTDLAVIKVNATGLQAATLGDSAILKVGEPVVAVGSPFGLDKTVTSGIISALGRTTIQETQTNITAYTNLIQTDAAINPGNSGGELVNMAGQVIGINALIQSPSGNVGAAQSAGIGFAIHMNSAKQIADEIIKTGKATHAYMGV